MSQVSLFVFTCPGHYCLFSLNLEHNLTFISSLAFDDFLQAELQSVEIVTVIWRSGLVLIPAPWHKPSILLWCHWCYHTVHCRGKWHKHVAHTLSRGLSVHGHVPDNKLVFALWHATSVKEFSGWNLLHRCSFDSWRLQLLKYLVVEASFLSDSHQGCCLLLRFSRWTWLCLLMVKGFSVSFRN